MNILETNKHIKNNNDILYILTREQEDLSFRDAIYDSSGNIAIYISYKNDIIKILGIEIKNKQDCLYYYNPDRIFSYKKDEYLIIRFISIDEDYLLQCTIEMPIDNIPLYIYKDNYDKLIQIVLYEKTINDIHVLR